MNKSFLKIFSLTIFMVSLFFSQDFNFNKASALTPTEKNNIQVYKSVGPSVVSIYTLAVEYNFFLDASPKEGAGSGVVIDKLGHILTNYHVIEGANKINIAFGDEKKVYPAIVVGVAPKNDLAVLKVKAPTGILKPAKLGNSDNLQVGQSVSAIGNPFGILGRTMTTGIVSALGRSVQLGDKIFSQMIQTDASINSGNSGGPLVNSSGEVIGINTVIFSRSGGSVGIGFSIPINIAKRFIPDLISKGKVTYPSLGVWVQPLSSQISELLKLPVSEGLLITNVIKGSAAQKAGIRGGNREVQIGRYRVPVGGDIIVGVDNQKITSDEELSSYIRSFKKVGDFINVIIVRGKRALTIKVRLQAK